MLITEAIMKDFVLVEAAVLYWSSEETSFSSVTLQVWLPTFA